jgi:hypothetical protein
MGTVSNKGRLGAAFGLLAILAAAILAAAGSAAAPSALEHAIQVQEQHSDELLDRGAIVGTGVGEDVAGAPEIVVYAERPVQVAGTMAGVPVDVEVTGPITAGKAAGKGGKPGGGKPGGGSAEPGPTGTFTRPVPIGVSTGNAGECSAGTIGARVKDGSGNVYALSNNHVYALENTAPLGSTVLQPGRYDTGCSFDVKNSIGTLSAYEPIEFSSTAGNVVDAAIAKSSTAALGNSTPAGGYGTPSSTTVAAKVGQAVQKFGRTTSLTTGKVTSINGIVEVSYGAGVARFVNQVFVESRKAFLKAGDSGSLLVTQDANPNPVGLLFASDSSGRFAIANPIGPVLAELGVSIDGR